MKVQAWRRARRARTARKIAQPNESQLPSRRNLVRRLPRKAVTPMRALELALIFFTAPKARRVHLSDWAIRSQLSASRSLCPPDRTIKLSRRRASSASLSLTGGTSGVRGLWRIRQSSRKGISAGRPPCCAGRGPRRVPRSDTKRSVLPGRGAGAYPKK